MSEFFVHLSGCYLGIIGIWIFINAGKKHDVPWLLISSLVASIGVAMLLV